MNNANSVLNNILFRISSYDKNASSIYEIDSKKEVDQLGAYLNGEMDDFDIECYGMPKPQGLNKDIYDYLKNLYESLKNNYIKKNKDELSIQEIEEKVSSFSNQEKVNKKDYNKIIKSLNLENISDINPLTLIDLCSDMLLTKNIKQKKLNEGREVIENLLLEKAKELKVNEEDLTKAASHRETNFTGYINLLIVAIQKMEDYNAEVAEKEKIKNKPISKSDDTQTLLMQACENHFAKNDILYTRKSFGEGRAQINGEVQLGSAKQLTENCWLMGGLNSLAATENGKKLLSKNIYRDQKHGVTAVYLGEAKEFKRGENGTGIYIIPDYMLKDLLYSDGDLDIAAYNIAIQMYFTEKEKKEKEEKSNETPINNDNKNLNGNTVQRLYEIITGQEAKSSEEKIYADKENIITTTLHPKYNNYRNKDTGYQDIIDTFKNGAAIVIGIGLSDISNGKIEGRHAFSIVGITEDGKIILQESNNAKRIAECFESRYEDEETGTWNIILTEDDFNKLYSITVASTVPD